MNAIILPAILHINVIVHEAFCDVRAIFKSQVFLKVNARGLEIFYCSSISDIDPFSKQLA